MTNEHGGDLPVRKEDGSISMPGLGCQHCPASFFSEERWHNHMEEKHSDKPRSVAWVSGPHKISYFYRMMPAAPHFYLMEDAKSGKMLSNMALNENGEILGLETHPEHQRQGLATKLWNEAQQHSKTMPGVPAPQHSTMRTPEGESWAQKVSGGSAPAGRLISSRQMRGMIDFERQ